MESWIIRVSLVDQPDQPILMRVVRKQGGYPLDLDLLATDGDNAWRTKVRERKIEKLRSSSHDGTAEEWSNILQYVFVSRYDTPLPPSLRNNLECICSIKENGTKPGLTITLRTRVEDITHRLGAIDLQHSDNTDDVDLFAWTSQVVERRDALADQLQDGKDKVQRAERTIESLEQQLQDLVTAKEDHETQLLTKFIALLNEKKLRIRTQQRQIAEHDEVVKGNDPKQDARNPRKRRLLGKQTTGTTESDESEGFEYMQAEPPVDGETDVEPLQTSSDESEKQEVAEPLSRQKQKTGASVKVHQGSCTTPPPRALPFTIGRGLSGVAPHQERSNKVMVDDEETASEGDDEL